VSFAVATSASVTLRLALSRLSGRRSSVVTYVNDSEQQVEVGVHRGRLRSAMLQITADFDPAAQKSSISTGLAVESII
jgi:hypothetical protein